MDQQVQDPISHIKTSSISIPLIQPTCYLNSRWIPTITRLNSQSETQIETSRSLNPEFFGVTKKSQTNICSLAKKILHLMILPKFFGLLSVATAVITTYYWRFCDQSFFHKTYVMNEFDYRIRFIQNPCTTPAWFWSHLKILGPLHSRKLKLLNVSKDEKFRLLFQISGLPCHHIEAQSSCHRLCGTWPKPDHKANWKTHWLL